MLLDTLSNFRDAIRKEARVKNFSTANVENVKNICESIRFPKPDESIVSTIYGVAERFRQTILENANDARNLLSACDKIRDDHLPLLGIRIEDTKSSSIWKLDDPNATKNERDQRIRNLTQRYHMRRNQSSK